jgi:hypothetical protein
MRWDIQGEKTRSHDDGLLIFASFAPASRAKSIKRHIHVLRRHGWEIDFDYRERTYVLRSAPRPSLF